MTSLNSHTRRLDSALRRRKPLQPWRRSTFRRSSRTWECRTCRSRCRKVRSIDRNELHKLNQIVEFEASQSEESRSWFYFSIVSKQSISYAIKCAQLAWVKPQSLRVGNSASSCDYWRHSCIIGSLGIRIPSLSHVFLRLAILQTVTSWIYCVILPCDLSCEFKCFGAARICWFVCEFFSSAFCCWNWVRLLRPLLSCVSAVF